LHSQVCLEAKFEIALEKEKANGNQIWPNIPTWPVRDEVTRQQAGPTGPLHARLAHKQKRPCVLKAFSGTAKHYYHRLKLCT
jgi:hypothetical protein